MLSYVRHTARLCASWPVLFPCVFVVACADAGEPVGPGVFAEESLSGYTDPLSAPGVPTLNPRDFAGAEQCKSCHPQHYAEWQHSAHATSMKDPVFRALLERQREDLGNAGDRFCTQCHSAIGTRSGDIQPGFAFGDLSPLTHQGVTCEGCHRVTSLERTHNSGHVIDPEAPMQGPFADAMSPHASARSELLGSSEFCGGCHDVQDPTGLVLESPLAEWQASPAADAGKSCQHCHMPSYRGAASSAPDAPVRETLHRHGFTGVEVPLALSAEELAGGLAAELRAQSLSLLKSSVALRLSVANASAQTGELRLETVVENLVDGHAFPTGSAFHRQFWLALEVVDATGTILHQTGGLDAEGDLFDGMHPHGGLMDPGLVVFGATLRDEVGELTMFPWRAQSLEKHVLAPLAKESIVHSVPIPRDAHFPLSVRARLRFRAFAPRLLRALDLEALLPRLHIIDIVDVTAIVSNP